MPSPDFTISCSDDELSSEATGTKGNLSWTPSPEEIIALYSTMESKEYLPLEWKCPGRRPPSEDGMEEEKDDKEEAVEEEVDKNFDFDESDGTEDAVNTPGKSKFSTPQHKRLRTPGTPGCGLQGLRTPGTPGSVIGSARKVTTSLNDVLANMRKHKILDDDKDTSKDNK